MKTSHSIVLLELGHIAVLVVAAIVLLSIEGSGFVCPSFGILLAGAALLRAVSTCAKGPLRSRAISLVLMTLFVSWMTGSTVLRTSPKAMFCTYVADSIPASVRILHSEYQGGRDPAVYLHFHTSPSDLDAILQTRSYTMSEDGHGPIGPHPDWWQPQSFAEWTLYYWGEDEVEGSAAWLWVDESRHEAFFTYWDF